MNVVDSSTLIDPHSSSSIMQIGSKQIEERLISLPGRSVKNPGASRSLAGCMRGTLCCIPVDRSTRRSLCLMEFR